MVKTKKITKIMQLGSTHQWGMIQIALWGFSTVITFMLLLFSFFPMEGSTSTNDPMDSLFATISFLPLLIFWVWVVLRYKQYRWNWWRRTLVANALLYSGSILYGAFLPQSGDTSSGIDFVSIAILLILLLSFYIFGKDQFQRKDKKPV
jgi:hypothetical protein